MTVKHIAVFAVSAVLVMAAGAAMADKGKPGKGHGDGGQVIIVPGPAAGTPPGLAKKPMGMPPGQAKKIYRAGQHLPHGYVWIDDLNRWRLQPLKPGQGYVRYDGEVYRVARDTAVVIEAIGIVSDLFN